MKNLTLTFLLCLFSILSYSQLYIGGVIDGDLSGGNPKGIQICANAAVPDMSLYGVGSANNGGGSDGQEFTFPAEMAAAGTCFWVGGSTTGWMAFFGFDPCFTSGAANINGDDAVELFCNGAVIDVFGDPNTNGDGECWDYTDGWAVATDNVASTTFACTDYTYSGAGGLDGETSNATAATPYPSPTQVCPMPIVPVTLKSFVAHKSENTVALNWVTATELNNDHFSVEWSTDGANFTSLDRVEGNGTSNIEQEYNYTHETAYDGNNYYRLKQVDHDGAFEFSHTLSIKGARASRKITLRPSVVSSHMTVEGAEISDYQILSIDGKVLESTNAKGNNTLDLINLAQGFYFLKMDLGQGKFETLRFIKQ